MRIVPVLIVLTAISEAAVGAVGDYAQEIRSDAPVGWWRFDDRASSDGCVARDAMGLHPGNYHGNVTLGDDGPTGGKAAMFDGKTSYISVPDDRAFSLDTMSVEFWFLSTQAWDHTYWPASATFVTKATPGAASGDWCVQAGSRVAGRNQGRILAASGPSGGAGDSVLVSRGRLNDGQWHHVIWTRSHNGTCALYVDGEVVDLASDGGGPIANTRPIQIGGEGILTGGMHLRGRMAEVAIYATVLSPERVRAHHAASHPEMVGGVPINGGGPGKPIEMLTLTNNAGLRWDLERYPGGWSLGRMYLHSTPVESGVCNGLLALRHIDTDEERWLTAGTATRLNSGTARLAGRQQVDGTMLSFDMEVSLKPDVTAALLSPRWSVDRSLDGWEVCLSYHGVGGYDWRCTLYPFAGNAEVVNRDRLTYVGVPAAVMFRRDLSLVTLFGIDPASDYLNPTTWTGATGFHFRNRFTPPQFRVGGCKLKPGVKYDMPLQVFLNDSGRSAEATTTLVRDWIKINNYKVQPIRVRTPQQAFDLYLEGRRKSRMWRPGKGYQIMDLWKIVYTAESPVNAYLDYLIYEQTGDAEWRKRAFDTLEFMLAAQHTDPNDPHYGVIETNYELNDDPAQWRMSTAPLTERDITPFNRPGRFNSADHSPNFGYKLDMNGYAARYMLMLWQRVRQKEGIDKRAWYDAAVRIADWIVRQQNPDGGLPQVVDYRRGAQPSMSVICGRTLVAMPIIHKITGDPKYAKLAADMEQFLRDKVEGRFWFSGAHVDLWPKDFEADSVWQAVEYWLNRYDDTRDPEALRRAQADAWFAFLMWCPKQLSWVKNPTQTCHAEQENYLQYSNYCYNNRKYYCLDRLARFTGDPLFGELRDRVIQCGFWGQKTDGEYMGSQHERMSDPWLGVSKDVNSLGALYFSELALEANLQLIEIGLVRARR